MEHNYRHHLLSIVALGLAMLLGAVALAEARSEAPRVEMETSKGTIIIELDPAAAPKTTANFLAYVKSGFYDHTIFHRVIKGFMIQGGGFDAGMHRKPTRPPIANEADNGLKNKAGTIAMARTRRPDSATSQFFINVVDNPFLDHKNKTGAGWGYCVFGHVVQGMDVVQAIEKEPTTVKGRYRDVPAAPVIINKMTVVPSQPQEKAMESAPR